MYLKSLTLRGFKSFASATTLRLEPGITCVVGPNGSGKSNVVDALVLGDGRAGRQEPARRQDGRRHLRRHHLAAPRSAAPRSTLTIDNTDGALPIDYAEVTISRLMFRSGQSEYAINGDSCRLLDVQDLLSDSGLGREMHVIVGQGQLDQILHAGPEARRAIIEEAAGVLKHRKRKEKALRKLEAMQANLTRLVDLTARARPAAQAARQAGRGRAQGRHHPGRPARRQAPAARRRLRDAAGRRCARGGRRGRDPCSPRRARAGRWPPARGQEGRTRPAARRRRPSSARRSRPGSRCPR